MWHVRALYRVSRTAADSWENRPGYAQNPVKTKEKRLFSVAEAGFEPAQGYSPRRILSPEATNKYVDETNRPPNPPSFL